MILPLDLEMSHLVKQYGTGILKAIKNHTAEKYLRIFGYVWQNKLGENVIN